MTPEFTLIIQGLNLDDDRQGDALLERCDDATFGEVDGLGYGDFHRDAATLADALVGAINDVESIDGLQVLRAEPDALVTAAEIADRLNISKEYVRLLANGERGDGSFPPAGLPPADPQPPLALGRDRRLVRPLNRRGTVRRLRPRHPQRPARPATPAHAHSRCVGATGGPHFRRCWRLGGGPSSRSASGG